MRAIVLRKTDAGPDARLEEFPEADLMPGDLRIRVSHSTLNYKDGLAIVRGAPVVRRWPMIPGIDLAGTVEHSDSPDFCAGEAVLVNGWGMGEAHLGAYAERVRVPAGWPILQPRGLTAAQAMAIGTAGYTAMLCLMALEKHGLTPAAGPLLVTGAAGGVGSVAVALAARAGWHVVASTGRPAEDAYLRGLGAKEVIDRAELAAPGKPLGRERWIAAIDSVGSHTLATVLSHTRENGAVAACGLAQGMDLPATVAPFILRGVSLLGVNSVSCPRALRQTAWRRLASELDHEKLATMTQTVQLDEVIALAPQILAGQVRGRVVVEVG
jgi:acrylyl-CoA reductase (NADPH)